MKKQNSLDAQNDSQKKTHGYATRSQDRIEPGETFQPNLKRKVKREKQEGQQNFERGRDEGSEKEIKVSRNLKRYPEYEPSPLHLLKQLKVSSEFSTPTHAAGKTNGNQLNQADSSQVRKCLNFKFFL